MPYLVNEEINGISYKLGEWSESPETVKFRYFVFVQDIEKIQSIWKFSQIYFNTFDSLETATGELNRLKSLELVSATREG